MKKLLVLLSALFISTIAFAHTIEWYVDDSVYDTTTCSAGDNITPPTAPAKYGYHFVEWELPPYIQLEYIESTGTQQIDTGVFASSNNFRIVAKFSLNSLPTPADPNRLIYGRFYSTTTNTFGMGFVVYAADNTFYARMLYGPGDAFRQTSVVYTNWKVNTIYEVVSIYTPHNIYASINGDPVVNINKNIGVYTTNKLPIANGIDTKTYSVQMYDNDVLIRDFIPAKRIADNAIGMYDSVTKTFFENQGTGTFIAGPELGYIQ